MLNSMPKLMTAAMVVAGLAAQPALAGETRKFDDLVFNEIVVLGDIKVEISQDDDSIVLVNGPSDVLDNKPFYVSKETLVLGKSKTYRGGDNNRIRFKVATPELRELRVKGSGEAYVKEFVLMDPDRGGPPTFSVEGSGDIKLFGLEGETVELRVKGSGDIKAVDIEIGDIEAVVSGSGDLFIQTLQADTGEFVVTGSGDLGVTEGGYVKRLEVNVIGSGDAHLSEVDCDSVEVNIVGSGGAELGVIRDQLNASVLGSGDVRYKGDPKVDKVEFGSGEVRQRK